MPSLIYLIFAKKQRITFFDPPGGLGEIFFYRITDRIRFCKSLSPFFSRAWVQNRFLPRQHSLIFIPNCLAHFYVGSISPTNSFAVRTFLRKSCWIRKGHTTPRSMILWGDWLSAVSYCGETDSAQNDTPKNLNNSRKRKQNRGSDWFEDEQNLRSKISLDFPINPNKRGIPATTK